MDSQESVQESEIEHPNNGRHPILLIAGFIILGTAVVLLLFGNTLFRRGNAELSPVFDQVPALSAGDSVLPTLAASSGPLLVGDLAHDFALQDLDGNTVQLSDLRGKPVIVNFWATWCAPCRIEMPELQAAFTEHADKELTILAIDQQEQPDIVREFFYNQMGLTFTPLLDTESAVSDLYGTGMVYPTTFFINGAGEVTAVHRGPMTKSQIDGYLENTLPVG